MTRWLLILGGTLVASACGGGNGDLVAQREQRASADATCGAKITWPAGVLINAGDDDVVVRRVALPSDAPEGVRLTGVRTSRGPIELVDEALSRQSLAGARIPPSGPYPRSAWQVTAAVEATCTAVRTLTLDHLVVHYEEAGEPHSLEVGKPFELHLRP